MIVMREREALTLVLVNAAVMVVVTAIAYVCGVNDVVERNRTSCVCGEPIVITAPAAPWCTSEVWIPPPMGGL